MIYTKPEEIEVVKQNIKIFDGRIPERIVKLLLTPQERHSQHSLFYSLCDPRISTHLMKALKDIKNYNLSFFTKAVTKLVNDPDRLNHPANVAEIVVVGYYCNKFVDHKSIHVKWERNVGNGNRNVDLSLLGHKLPINIEITGLHQDAHIRRHFDLGNTIKVVLERFLLTISDPKFSFVFSIPEESNFQEVDIDGFVKFILRKREDGEGVYTYQKNDKKLASVEIKKLNTLTEEYATDVDMFTGWLNDDKRLKSKIVEKARDQLPNNEINFICVPNLAGFDTMDMEEAFLGKEQWCLNSKGDFMGKFRKRDGAVFIIQENNYSPVQGLIAFTKDYSKKKIIDNPLTVIDEDTKKIIK